MLKRINNSLKSFRLKFDLNSILFFSICCSLVLLFTICIGAKCKEKNKSNINIIDNLIETSSQVLDSKKIEWGIKRANNHKQPDLGSINKKIIDEACGIAIGNKDSKNVYLTFDEGYEAGYTPKILEVLKQNEVPAAFFITAHFVNSQPELVKRMIDEGHIVGNQSPHTLMEL